MQKQFIFTETEAKAYDDMLALVEILGRDLVVQPGGAVSSCYFYNSSDCFRLSGSKEDDCKSCKFKKAVLSLEAVNAELEKYYDK